MIEKKKTYKLDIFRLLKCISTKDIHCYETIPEDHRKELHPLIVMRWLSGTKKSEQILLLNEIVNPLVFPLASHKKLLVSLMVASSSGRFQRFVWNAKPKNGTPSFPKACGVIKKYFNYNTKDAIDALPNLNNETLISMARDLGFQKDELTGLKTEIRKRIK